MAGIYIHIPFCKTRCIYCDFYSTTRSELKERYIHALCRELEIRRQYLQGEPIETIYFGGGTPSQLSGEDFQQVFDTIEKTYGIKQVQEITLEANPDDLTPQYVQTLTKLPFNRISMGLQTFDEATLRLLNRRHTAAQAITAIERCREAGFRNISIDLIYGLPGETAERWEHDLTQAIALNPEHISAYHLIYEEGTPIYKMLQQHRVSEVDEESSVYFFSSLIDRLTTAGYEHYEISNFCRPGYHSRHNTSYWQGIPYLGCGPSAHSFNRREREWNIASLNKYLQGIESGERACETEILDTTTRYNECIITSIRTSQGLSLTKLKEEFGTELWQYCLNMAAHSIKNGMLEERGDNLRLTRKGIFISDSIMSDLLKVEE
ncbi:MULTISPECIES: radical SAM family heme chaperone HemW [Bacteroides]|uniref:radical SAM family heme chaperone HemW n=1 Tax=Bacteroides TaxID=816 RepID=UPI00259CD5CB|nr:MULTISPECIES: radical SAM family heme chaperone HemW [Bacteroides]